MVVSCLSFKIKMILDDYSYYVRMLLAIIRSMVETTSGWRCCFILTSLSIHILTTVVISILVVKRNLVDDGHEFLCLEAIVRVKNLSKVPPTTTTPQAVYPLPRQCSTSLAALLASLSEQRRLPGIGNKGAGLLVGDAGF